MHRDAIIYQCACVFTHMNPKLKPFRTATKSTPPHPITLKQLADSGGSFTCQIWRRGAHPCKADLIEELTTVTTSQND